ncbi:MAG TPA: radical SAM protein [Bacteroidales bacterium]|nr:radical SAM protein [Bacteroidales bacterium]
MRKLLLINTNTEKAPYPVPPVGLCMLASAVASRYEVRLYDGAFDEGTGLPEILRTFHPDFIGFSIRNIDDIVMDRNIYYPDAIIRRFIEPVKKLTSAPLILGGSGFSMFPEELIKITGADWGIRGEGEEVLPALLERIEKGTARDLPRVLTAADLRTGPEPVLLPGGRKPFAEIDRYLDFGPYKTKGAYGIQTKRGCSHGCIYCTYPVIEGKSFRARPATDIVEEIQQASDRLGDVTFEFVDSTFNEPEGHAESICREIIRRKIRPRLRTMGIHPRHASRELFELMREAGFAQIDATPDSASPAVLRNLDKGFGREDIRKMARLIREADLPTMWFFLFGGPGENEQTIGETRAFIEEYIHPDDLVYLNSGLRIYPNTPLQEIAVKEGRIRQEDSLLYPPVYYFSEALGKEGTDRLTRSISEKLPNCLPALETAPPPEMVQEALSIRQQHRLTEPMFRTLVRIRREWIKNGKLTVG